MTIRAVFFDFGGVLSTRPLVGLRAFETEMGYPHRAMLDMIFHSGSESVRPGEPAEDDWDLLEKGRVELSEFIARIVARSEAVLGQAWSPGFFGELFDRYMTVAGITGVHWALVHRARSLRTEGYRTAIVTNQIRAWAPWRSFVPVGEFDAVVDSCEVGLRKPEPAIYELACRLVDVEPADAVMLDDSLRNVEGARRAGLQAILVANPALALIELDQLLSDRAGRASTVAVTHRPMW